MPSVSRKLVTPPITTSPVKGRTGQRCLRVATTQATMTATSDRKSTRLNSSHSQISYAVFCLKKKKKACRLGRKGRHHRAGPSISGYHLLCPLQQPAVGQDGPLQWFGRELALHRRCADGPPPH